MVDRRDLRNNTEPKDDGWELDMLGKASLPAPRSSDAEFLAGTRRRVRRRSALRLAGALSAAALLLALGIGWLMPARDDQAVIENLAVLEDLQDLPADLLPLLTEESRRTARGDVEDDEGIDDDLIQQLLLEEGGKRG
jgi:hypothetical protein